LLTGDERRRLFELPADDREVARHHKLLALGVFDRRSR
jgi:hypothetical protein